MKAIPKGAIKRFRERLNALDAGNKHRHLAYQQRTRRYGDYLYHQDHDRFMAELRQWLSKQA